jgi:hypothetical protein
MKRILRVAAGPLLVAFLIAVAAWSLHASYQRGQHTPVGSSRRSDARGTRALFLLLEEKGHHPRRLIEPAPPAEAVLVAVEPGPVHPDDQSQLLNWLEQGGILILAGSARSTAPGNLGPFPGPDPSWDLLELLGLEIEETAERPTPENPPDEEDVTPPKEPMAVFSRTPRRSEVVRGSADHPWMVRFPYGQGTVHALADPRGLENAGVLRGDALPWAMDILLREGRPVYFDEFRHGLKSQPGLAYVLERYGLLSAVVALVFLLALVAWRALPAETEPSPPSPQVARGTRDSLADIRSAIYARTITPVEALARMQQDLQRNLAARLGEPAHSLPLKELRSRLLDKQPHLVGRFDELCDLMAWLQERPPRSVDALIPAAQRLVRFLDDLECPRKTLAKPLAQR